MRKHCNHWFRGEAGCCYCGDFPLLARLYSIVFEHRALKEDTVCAGEGICSEDPDDPV